MKFDEELNLLLEQSTKTKNHLNTIALPPTNKGRQSISSLFSY